MVKLTPLNIALAVVLVWLISEWNMDQDLLFSWGWLVVWIIIIALIDLGYRVLIKDLKKLWMLQIGFILIVGILMILLKLL